MLLNLNHNLNILVKKAVLTLTMRLAVSIICDAVQLHRGEGTQIALQIGPKRAACRRRARMKSSASRAATSAPPVGLAGHPAQLGERRAAIWRAWRTPATRVLRLWRRL